MNAMWLVLFVPAMIASMVQGTPVVDPAGLTQIAAAQGVKQVPQSGGAFLYAFVREGVRRESLVLTAGAAFETAVANPGRRKCVSLMAAMPFNLGDGAVLKISIRDAAQQDSAIQLFLDPVHVRSDRTWRPLRLEIPSAPDHFILQIQVDAGSRGNNTADWIGLAAGGESECLLAARGEMD